MHSLTSVKNTIRLLEICGLVITAQIRLLGLIKCICFQLWELASGMRLCKFVFNSAVTSVIMDTCNYRMFAGLTSGNIIQVNLFDKVTF